MRNGRSAASSRTSGTPKPSSCCRRAKARRARQPEAALADSGQPPFQDPADDLLHLLGGKHRAQALSTAAALGIADRLRERQPQTATELAEAIGSPDPDALASLLQLLAGLGYLQEPEPGAFALTPHGELLCADALGPFAAFLGCAEQWDPWSRLRDTLTDPQLRGRTPFELSNGAPLYEHMAADPGAATRYDRAIDAFTRHEARLLAEHFPDGVTGTIVDVGGGRGTLLHELLPAWPNARGVLFDLAHVITAARAAVPTALCDRLDFVAGDFFEAVPAGGDLYIVKHVLHNWDDDRAVGLLQRCATAMAAGGRILVIDAVLAPDSRPDLARLLDLEMRVLTAGRERRKPEIRRLFTRAGLRLAEVEQLTAASWMLLGTRA